jgi:hypothetical protein
MAGWKHKTSIIVGNQKNPTKMESGQVIINKKATKQNLNKLIEINNDGLDKEKSKISTDGKDGGLLKGPAHYDKNGNSLGGIPVVVDGGKKIEVEGDEFVVNKEASQKHWKELSKINQSAGNGVAINPQDVGYDEDPQEYKEGGAIIEFNPNDLPNKWIYSYAKNIKEKYPKVWGLGGNIFGNEAFKNLERVLKRGYWTDNEEWMYIKWRSFVARHKKDYRIAGVIAMLKWVDKVEKGWPYMKDLIEKEIAKKYPNGWKHKKAKGGPVTYKNKYNKKYGYEKNESHDLKEIAKDTEVSKKGLQQIYNKGIGAYKTNPQSVRPNVKSKEQWAMARVYSAVMGGKAARIDAKELKMNLGGELKKGIKAEQEHINTAKKLYQHKISPEQSAESIAREHLKEDKNYYSKLAKMEKFNTGGAATGFEDGDILRGEYFPGIYGNFLVIFELLGADSVKVRNLLTGEESIKDYRDFTLFLKKGSGQTTQPIDVQQKEGVIKAPMPTTPISDNPPSYLPSTVSSNWVDEFNVGDKVRIRVDFTGDSSKYNTVIKEKENTYDKPENIFTIVSFIKDNKPYKLDKKGNNIGGFIRPENPSGKLYTLSNGDAWEGKDLELVKATTNKDAIKAQPSKPKFVSMDFKPLLENWVNSNFTNSTLLTKKDIVKETITNYILDVEAVDGNQTIQFNKETEILDNIDNYLN